jgi:hypothetical protein
MAALESVEGVERVLVKVAVLAAVRVVEEARAARAVAVAEARVVAPRRTTPPPEQKRALDSGCRNGHQSRE